MAKTERFPAGQGGFASEPEGDLLEEEGEGDRAWELPAFVQLPEWVLPVQRVVEAEVQLAQQELAPVEELAEVDGLIVVMITLPLRLSAFFLVFLRHQQQDSDGTLENAAKAILQQELHILSLSLARIAFQLSPERVSQLPDSDAQKQWYDTTLLRLRRAAYVQARDYLREQNGGLAGWDSRAGGETRGDYEAVRALLASSFRGERGGRREQERDGGRDGGEADVVGWRIAVWGDEEEKESRKSIPVSSNRLTLFPLLPALASAFGNVTNGCKVKAGSSTAATKPAATKPTAAAAPAGSSTRRTYRTRSSTGGATSAVKGEPIGEEDEGEGEEASDAMAIDGAEDIKPARQIKSLKRTAAGASKTVTGTTAATSRPALAARRANSASTSTGAASARSAKAKASAAVKQAPPVVRDARRRRAEPEERHRAALEKLEEAKVEEEQLEADLALQRKLEAQGEPEYAKEEFADEEGDFVEPLMVSAYVVEVYKYLRELELTTMPEPDYMSNQNEVTWKMRGILVDWLVEIHTKFRLLPETIFLAVNIIDRFLSLVGVTTLFIAAKYEEVCCPSVQSFLYMIEGGYNGDEILKPERYILGIIGFNLSYPNPINFLRRISKADGYDMQSRTIAKFLMEISIVDHRFMATPPSLIAAGASWLACKVLGKGHWDANLVHYSGYSEGADADAEGNPLALSPGQPDNEHPNFIKKYSAKKFFKASTAMRKWAEEDYRAMDGSAGLLARAATSSPP
ncbi:hypothetical protein JCM8097_001710 [Rhodosporidiobolus ruineniae]